MAEQQVMHGVDAAIAEVKGRVTKSELKQFAQGKETKDVLPALTVRIKELKGSG